MPTIKVVRKIAKQIGFIDEMAKLGFTIGKNSLWFYRKREGYIDFFEFWLKSSANWVKVPAVCVTEKILFDYDFNKFPEKFNRYVPIISDSYIGKDGVEIGAGAWKIENEDRIVETLYSLESVIKSKANSWFKSISSDELLYESMSIRMRETELGNKIKNALLPT